MIEVFIRGTLFNYEARLFFVFSGNMGHFYCKVRSLESQYYVWRIFNQFNNVE